MVFQNRISNELPHSIDRVAEPQLELLCERVTVLSLEVAGDSEGVAGLLDTAR